MTTHKPLPCDYCRRESAFINTHCVMGAGGEALVLCPKCYEKWLRMSVTHAVQPPPTEEPSRGKE